jgi:hypothetical protein
MRRNKYFQQTDNKNKKKKIFLSSTILAQPAKKEAHKKTMAISHAHMRCEHTNTNTHYSREIEYEG